MLSIRNYDPDIDLLSLHRLLTAVESHDQDGENISEEALRQQLTWNNHEPRLDCWVIENPEKSGELVGYGSVSGRAGSRCTVYTAVHHKWRRRGLGSRLLGQTIVRGKETDADHFIVNTNAQNNGSNAFLQMRGYEPVGDAWILSAPAAQSFAKPVWPSGFTVRSFAEVGETAVLADIMNRSYGDMWGHSQNEHPTTPEGIAEIIPKLFQPQNIFLAFTPDGNVAGLVFGIPGERIDVIDSPGAAPEYRHLGLQLPLLLTTTHHLQSRQSNPIQLLSYGDSEKTIHIFQEVGFQLNDHYVTYQGQIA